MSESAPVGALRAFARSKPTEFDAFLAKWLQEYPQEEEQPNDTIIDDNDTWTPDSDTDTQPTETALEDILIDPTELNISIDPPTTSVEEEE